MGETLDLEGRLLYPTIDGQRVGWERALDTVAGRFGEIIERHGPDAVAFYVSGQLLTEDYYVANKLMRGFIGSANIDTNSRLCMSSSVAGHKRAFGSDMVPGCYEDWEQTDLLILTGSNTAWCHPVLYQRAAAAKKARPHMKVVVIDPRRTATSDIADLHLAPEPGTDAILFSGLLAWLYQQGHGDAGFVAEHTEGMREALTGDWAVSARGMLQADAGGAQWSEMLDSAQQAYRGARFVAGRLDSCVFVGPDHCLPPRDWLMVCSQGSPSMVASACACWQARQRPGKRMPAESSVPASVSVAIPCVTQSRRLACSRPRR